DGTANTILFAEHYAVCDTVAFFLWGTPITGPTGPIFADSVYPVVRGSPPLTGSSRPGETFQVRPCPRPREECGTWKACYPGLAQTPHLNGMLAGMSDGSVHIIAATVSEQTFWAAVTPAAGDLLGRDW